VVIDREAIGRALALVVRLGLSQGAQPGIPVGFQGVGDETVGGIDVHVAVPGAVGLVLARSTWR